MFIGTKQKLRYIYLRNLVRNIQVVGWAEMTKRIS